jgi:hypothetical protein
MSAVNEFGVERLYVMDGVPSLPSAFRVLMDVVMTSESYTSQAKAASGINVVLGGWLVASPWVFGYVGTSAAWNSVVIGALILIIGATRVVSLAGPFLARVNLVFGLWTIASPWIFGYAAGEPAMWNSIIVGTVVALMAIWSARAIVLRDTQESHFVTGR